MYFSSMCLWIRWWYYRISIGLLSPFLFLWAQYLIRYRQKALPLKYVLILSAALHSCFNQYHLQQDYSEAFVLVCSGCSNRTPQTGWLKQQKLIFLQFWSVKVQDQGARRVDFWWDISFLARKWLPSHCVLPWPFLSLCACSWLPFPFFCVPRACPVRVGSHPYDLI